MGWESSATIAKGSEEESPPPTASGSISTLFLVFSVKLFVFPGGLGVGVLVGLFDLYLIGDVESWVMGSNRFIGLTSAMGFEVGKISSWTSNDSGVGGKLSSSSKNTVLVSAIIGEKQNI